MADRYTTIKRFEEFIHYFNPCCIGDVEDHAMLKDVFELLKEQDKLLRKKQKDINKLCCDIADLKHRFHEKTEIVRCENCFFATQGITDVGEWYMRCRIFDIAVDTDFFCKKGKRK